MKIAIYIAAALSAYLINGLNPAIILSEAIYGRDIRKEGSGNPGFTNFMRVFGSKYAWWVFFLDLLKSVLVTLVFGLLFPIAGAGTRAFGSAYTAAFGLLGHAFPVWYGFHGGKGFLVNLAALYVLDWRAGILATALLAALLFTTHYMSLSTMLCLTAGSILLYFFGSEPAVILLYAGCVLFMIARHRENIVRLIHGTEKKFTFGKKEVQVEDLSRRN